MNYSLEKSWSELLSSRFTQEYKKELFGWLEKEYATKTVFPPKEKVNQEWEILKKRVFNNDEVIIRGYGRDAHKTQLYIDFYKYHKYQ